jgi:formimidoylglutamate deiminase
LGQIAVGEWADLVSLDRRHVDLAGLQGDTVLDSFVFAGDNRMVTDVWAAGRHMVQNGSHIRRAEITAAYARAVQTLRSGR